MYLNRFVRTHFTIHLHLLIDLDRGRTRAPPDSRRLLPRFHLVSALHDLNSSSIAGSNPQFLPRFTIVEPSLPRLPPAFAASKLPLAPTNTD